MSNLVVSKKNNIYLTIQAEPHVHYELSDYFTFDIPNAKFMPQYRSGVWDGKIRLYSPGTGELYCGSSVISKSGVESRTIQSIIKVTSSTVT